MPPAPAKAPVGGGAMLMVGFTCPYFFCSSGSEAEEWKPSGWISRVLVAVVGRWLALYMWDAWGPPGAPAPAGGASLLD